MKKMISVLLVAVLLLSALPLTAMAGVERFTVLPTVYLRGNGEDIVDEDGNVVYDFDVSSEQITAIAKRVLPLLLKGLLTNNFQSYFDAFGEEMNKLYDRCQLDENGKPKYGTDIPAEKREENAWRMHADNRNAKGLYDVFGAYNFNYDWRLDPLAVADELDAYIDGILEATGAGKVNLLCTCLGGDIVLSYMSKYGTDKLHGIGFAQTVAFGSELVDETFSGNMDLDPDSIERFANDTFVQNLLKDSSTLLKDFLKETLTLAQATGALDGLTNAFMKLLYNRLYKGLVPELAVATFATWPGYWSMVTAEHYASTRDFVFGQPGSERYEKFSGLIAKLDAYDEAVRQRIPQMLREADAAGKIIALTCFYGEQMPPVLQSADEQGDVWTTVRYASLGGTASKTGTTLSDEYIASRTAAGFGAKISPDRQIDASTGMFPDRTWYIKGAVHDDKILDLDMIFTYAFNDGATVDTVENYPQFLIKIPNDHWLAPMTEENMNVETYPVDAPKATFLDRIRTFFQHIGNWFRMLFSMLQSL